jgi:hypothetical protein
MCSRIVFDVGISLKAQLGMGRFSTRRENSETAFGFQAFSFSKTKKARTTFAARALSQHLLRCHRSSTAELVGVFVSANPRGRE